MKAGEEAVVHLHEGLVRPWDFFELGQVVEAVLAQVGVKDG
jgi:hypothetical protein